MGGGKPTNSGQQGNPIPPAAQLPAGTLQGTTQQPGGYTTNNPTGLPTNLQPGASPTPAGNQPPPWLQGAMGMMQAGQAGRPQMGAQMPQRRPMQPMGPIGGFMPQAQGPQQQLTPAMLNQLLAARSGLMGNGGQQF